MFFTGRQIHDAEAAHAVMSQHVAQQCMGESARALMSQHVAQQCTGESAQALMSQHVAQQSLIWASSVLGTNNLRCA